MPPTPSNLCFLSNHSFTDPHTPRASTHNAQTTFDCDAFFSSTTTAPPALASHPMKASGGPQKLRFTIHSCSGEVGCCCAADASVRASLSLFTYLSPSNSTPFLCTSMLDGTQDTDYPVRELLYHSPQTRGWQSPRYAVINSSAAQQTRPDSNCSASVVAASVGSDMLACLDTPHKHRFCKYPQELVLRLERSSKVQQIQILAHEFKVGSGSGRAGARVPVRMGCWLSTVGPKRWHGMCLYVLCLCSHASTVSTQQPVTRKVLHTCTVCCVMCCVRTDPHKD